MADAFGRERTARCVVQPEDSVLTRRQVPRDIHDRLIGGTPTGVLFARHLMETNVEIVQYPFPFYIVRRVLASDPALKDPISNQTAEPRIGAGRRLGADGDGSRNEKGDDQ